MIKMENKKEANGTVTAELFLTFSLGVARWWQSRGELPGDSKQELARAIGSLIALVGETAGVSKEDILAELDDVTKLAADDIANVRVHYDALEAKKTKESN